jgi:hypothetical protein
MPPSALPDDTVVLAAGLRLPQARAGGAYAGENAGHLGAALVRECLDRSGIDPYRLSEVILGCVGPPFDQANVARVIALRAGVPRSVPAHTVGRNCASGMEAVTNRRHGPAGRARRPLPRGRRRGDELLPARVQPARGGLLLRDDARALAAAEGGPH